MSKQQLKHTVILLFLAVKSIAQMGINATGAAPDSKAILDIASSTKGLLIPRMNTNQRNSIATTEGLTVYDIETHSYWFFKTPGGWTELASGGTSPWVPSGTDIINSNTGNVGIGIALPNKAGLVVNKKVGNVNAIFGDNISGVSIESNWPGIHFNSYLNGTRKTMIGGYASGMEMSATTGSLLFYTTPNTAATGANIASQTAMTISKDGNIGIGSSPVNTNKLFISGNLRVNGGIYNYQNVGSETLQIQRDESETSPSPILNLTNGYIGVNQNGTHKAAFQHVTAAANIVDNASIFSYPNQSPTDMIFLTHSFTEGNYAYGFAPFGVYYDATTSQWKIVTDDISTMRVGLRFNILVIKKTN